MHMAALSVTLTPLDPQAALIQNPLIVSPDTPVVAALHRMSQVRSSCGIAESTDPENNNQQVLREARGSCVLVVDQDRPIGIVTERDVVRLLAEQTCLDQLTVSQIMIQPLVTLQTKTCEDLDVMAAITLLHKHGIRHLPVLDADRRLVGLMTHESLCQTTRPIDLLRMRLASEVMTQHVVAIAVTSSMLDVARLMAECQVGSVVIVEPGAADSRQQPVGIVTERDLVQFQSLGLDFQQFTVREVMSTPVFTVAADSSLWLVHELMAKRNIQRVLVMGDRGELVGIVTQTSLLRVLNPLELYKLAELLEHKVNQLEAEKQALETLHHQELEQRVETRTAALRAKAERELLLVALATQIRSSLSLQSILDTTVQEVRRVLQCDRVNIWQFQTADKARARVVAESTDLPISMIGTELEGTWFQHDQEPVYRQGYIRVEPDVAASDMGGCHLQLPIELRPRAKILVPLLYQEELWGLLSVSESKTTRNWLPDEVKLLKGLSVQLEVALKQAITHQQLQQELETRTQAEAFLRESEQRYANLAAVVPVGIFRMDLQGRPTYVNERYCQILGCSIEEGLDWDWEQTLHPDDRDWVLALREQNLREQSSCQLECRFQSRDHRHGPDPDRAVTWVDMRVVVERDATGQPIGYVGTLTDISDRKRSALELRESRQRYASLLAVAPVGIFRTDTAGHCLYVNDHWCEMTGLDHRAALGHGWQLTLHPDDRALVINGWMQAIQTNRPWKVEYRLARPDGEVLWVYGQSVVERNFNGDIVGHVGAITNITDRKQADFALQNLIEGTAATGLDFFPALVKHLATALNVSHAFVAERMGNRIQVLAFWNAGAVETIATCALNHFDQELPYPWHGNCHPQLLQSLFPQVPGLTQITDNNYLSVPLQDSHGLEIGHLCILNQGPIQAPRRAETVLRIFAARAGAELERQQATNALEQLNQDLEITIQRRTQELWRVHNLHKAILNCAPYAVIATDIQGLITTFNPAAERMLGYRAAEVIRQLTPEIFHDRQEVAARAAQRSAELGEPIAQGFEVLVARARQGIVDENEWNCIRQDGSRFPAALSVSCLRDRNDQIIGFLGIAQDITDRKRTEQENRLLKERLEFLLASSPAVIYSRKLDRRYTTTFVSPNVESILGYTPQEFIQDANFWISRIHPQDVDRVLSDLNNLPEGSRYKYEYRLLHADGYYLWVRDELYLVRDEQNQLLEIVGYFADISDLKQTEAIVVQQAKRETLLLEITQRIRQSLDLSIVFETACQEIRQLMESDRVGIFQFNPESQWQDGKFVAESVDDKYPSVIAVSMDDRCFGGNYFQRYAQGQYCATDDIYDGSLSTCHADVLKRLAVRANLVMPLLCNGALWGLLCVHQCMKVRHWELSEIELIKQIANQLEIAIQQASLYDRMQAELLVRKRAEKRIALQLHQQELLGVISQRIRESLDVAEILQVVTDQVRQVFQCDRAIILQVFPDGHSQIFEESVAPGFPVLKNRQWADEHWSIEILEHYWQGEPRIVPDVMSDRWTDCLREYSQAGQIQSKVVAPILQEVHVHSEDRWVSVGHNNRLWGVLVIHACQEQRVWQGAEAKLLQQIANQLATAIQQANLFEQLQRELQERQQAQQQLTDRNQELAVSNQELARATRLKDEFLANMSHELRTPLNAILGITEGLQESIFGPITEQQERVLQTIERSGSHLLSLINDILDVAKIEAGQLELDIAAVPVSPLCQSSLAFVKQQAFKKGIQLAIQLPPKLPDLLVDERRVRQVLINLLNNAVKFTPDHGSVSLEVCLGTSRRVPKLNSSLGETEVHQFLEISVVDDGIGIAPEDVRKLFQPFMQVDSALNRQYTGTGLGLALVKRIVELHGGEVSLVSEVGVGSRFTVDLPCASTLSGPDQPATGAIEAAEPSPAVPLESPLILLAEDNEANVSTIVAYLQAKGYRLTLAKNGEEAVAFAKAAPPDLILMDIQMPVMDGLEATRQIRQDPTLANVPIIALTALAMAGDRERCLAAGASDYLSKPVRLKQLAAMIQEFLAAIS